MPETKLSVYKVCWTDPFGGETKTGTIQALNAVQAGERLAHAEALAQGTDTWVILENIFHIENLSRGPLDGSV